MLGPLDAFPCLRPVVLPRAARASAPAHAPRVRWEAATITRRETSRSSARQILRASERTPSPVAAAPPWPHASRGGWRGGDRRSSPSLPLPPPLSPSLSPWLAPPLALPLPLPRERAAVLALAAVPITPRS